MRLIRMVIWVCLAGATAAQAAATPQFDDRKASISGEVRHRDGDRLQRPVIVKLETITGTSATQSWTGSSGRFEFFRLSPGRYYLVVDSDGYQKIRYSVEFSIAPVEGIILQLVPLHADEPVLAGEVDVHSLQVPEKALKEFQKGVEQLNQRKMAESVPHFERAIAIYPQFDDAYIQLYVAYARQRDTERAQKTLMTAIEVNSRNWRAMNILGRFYRRQKEYDKAIEILQKSLSIHEGSWLAHVEMTESLAGLNRWPETSKYAARAHELNPKEPSIHQLYYNTLIRRSEYRTALAELDEFLTLFPQHALAARARQQRDALYKALANGEIKSLEQP